MTRTRAGLWRIAAGATPSPPLDRRNAEVAVAGVDGERDRALAAAVAQHIKVKDPISKSVPATAMLAMTTTLALLKLGQ